MFRLRVLRPHDGTALVATLTGFFFALHASVALPAADCNQNGIEDVVDISQGALDCNSNGVPDECEVKTLSETFLLPQEVFSPVEVYDIVAGDWNGDGQTDVAALGIANLATLFGNGRGELTPGPILRAPTNAQGPLKGDFDGDTDVDLVTLTADSKNITLLMNHGGTF